MRERTSSGSAACEAAVKPTRSQKRTVTTLRSSWIGAEGCSVSGAPQKGQNGNSPGNSLPQAGHVGTRAVYEGQPRIQTTRAVASRSRDIPALAQPEVRTPDPARLADTGDLCEPQEWPRGASTDGHVGIVVESLDAAISF